MGKVAKILRGRMVSKYRHGLIIPANEGSFIIGDTAVRLRGLHGLWQTLCVVFSLRISFAEAVCLQVKESSGNITARLGTPSTPDGFFERYA
jgi:hypothetical protein